MEGLGGKMFEMDFCEDHTGLMTICTNSSDCSLRSFWQIIQNSVDQVLQKFTLQDLLGPESEITTPEIQKVDVEFRN